jgi:NH3-dependent NAD+ synthetase
MDGVVIDDDGICNYCKNHQPFTPFQESELLKIFKKAKNKSRIYDALVPISGGKDSTYVLYLAVRKYKLNVLTYTFDNGFLSDVARNNEITREEGVQICNDDTKNLLPGNFNAIITRLNLTERNIQEISNIPFNIFSNKISVSNKIFVMARNILKKRVH